VTLDNEPISTDPATTDGGDTPGTHAETSTTSGSGSGTAATPPATPAAAELADALQSSGAIELPAPTPDPAAEPAPRARTPRKRASRARSAPAAAPLPAADVPAEQAEQAEQVDAGAAEPEAPKPAKRARAPRKKAAAAKPVATPAEEPAAAADAPETLVAAAVTEVPVEAAAAEPVEPATEQPATEETKPRRRRRATSSGKVGPQVETLPEPAPVAAPVEPAAETEAVTVEDEEPEAEPADVLTDDTESDDTDGRPAIMPLFQAPEPVEPRRRRAASRPAGPPVAAVEEETTLTPEPATEDVEATDAPAPRSRRSRGGRKSTSRSRRPVPDEIDEDAEAVENLEALTDTGVVEDPLEDTDEVEEIDESDEGETDEGDADEAEDASSSAVRRRRRRGGRGRRGRGRSDAEDASGEDAEDDAGETAEGAEPAEAAEGEDGDAEDGGDESTSSRRRRRRRRRGAGSDGASEDDPPNTVTRVRSSRGGGGGGRDDATGIKGSTRLEAKKQRRREGREAGRRRSILTEAEFLTRRESVERVMVVREREGRTQIGVLEDNVLVEHYVARKTQTSMVGNVYLGRVQNVLPSMEAAFVDIGKGRNAVLYAGEVNWDAAGLEGQPRRIEHALKAGQAVLVQVTKDPVGHKGARLTSQISMPGRYLVYVPDGSMTGISRKLPDTERSRLKKILREVVPDDAGVIVRTAAEGASDGELERDVTRLQAQWEDIKAKKETANAPALLYGEPDLAIRVVRDVFNEDFTKLIVSGDDAWETLQGYVAHVAPDLGPRLERWTSEKDIFAANRIDEQLQKGLDRKVWLPSGGSLVIDRTEAMTVVDVNTGKFTGAGGNLEETVTKNNLEAAEEVVRQLRLRDIGGIIVVDFIDMVLESNRELVMRRLLECLGRDRTRHQVAEVTSLGLVQMTRKRVGQGLLEVFSETCEHCGGRGLVMHDEPVEKKQQNGGGSGGGGGRRN
jgi:ribonuclease E